MKILVVDDNPDDRRLVSYLARQHGHECVEAVNGREGCEAAMATPPDLIISDALMPVMDGFQFLRTVKQNPALSSTPFIFYSSSYLEDRDMRLAMSLGADAYFIKPIEPADLWNRIQPLLDGGKKEKPQHAIVNKDSEYIKRYSEVVSAKLHDKIRDLEKALAERDRAEKGLIRLNRELRAISNCNQILLRATDESMLLDEICRIVCQEAGYRMAWVGYVENDESQSLRRVASCQLEDLPPEAVQLQPAAAAGLVDPAGIAIQSGRTYWIQDLGKVASPSPWRDWVLQQGFRSCIALPLADDKARAFGVLNIYSSEPNAFTPEEVRLLEELAGDLAFGLTALRLRVENARAQQEITRLSFSLSNVRESAFFIDKSGRFTFVNDEACRALELSREELLQLCVCDIDPDFPSERWPSHWSRLEARRSLLFETRHRTKSGRMYPVEINANYFVYGENAYVLALVRDITERKQAEESLRRLNRDLRAISDCNQMLMRASDEQSLLSEICRIVCDEAGYRMAWVGYALHDEARTIKPMAWAGAEDGYIAQVRISWADAERGRGPAGTVVRTGEPVLIQDIATSSLMGPWRENALSRGYRSGAAFPLKDEHDAVFGVFLIYAGQPDSVTPEELQLLKELAGDLAFGISVLRNRAERKRMDAINTSRLHLAQFAATHSLDELLEESLNEAEKLTGSMIGFYHFVENDQQTLTLQNWSTRTKSQFCKAEGKGRHYPIGQAGVWVDCVYQRKPVIHNDYAALPHRKGLPPGHAAVTRELVVPVLRGNKLCAILGVGNKPFDYDGKDVETLSLLADLAWEITERKRAEERVKYLALIVESSDDAIFGKTLEGQILTWNRGAQRIYGYTAEEIVGHHVSVLVPPEKSDELASIMDRVSRGETIEHLETTRVCKDSKMIEVALTVSAIRGPQGRIIGASTIARDITAHKRAENELRASESRFRTFVDHATDAFFLHDSDGTILDANIQACESLGLTRDELIGMSPYQIDADATPSLPEEIRRRLSTGEIVTWESRHRRSDGTAFPVEIRLRPFWVGGHRFSVSLVRDITERKRAETLLLNREKELRRLNRVLRTLSACNEALVRATNEADLLNTICKIIVDSGSYQRASVAFSAAGEPQSVRIVAQVDAGQLVCALADCSDRGPAAVAIRTGRPALVRCPDTVAPDDKNFTASTLSLPLVAAANTLGALTIDSANRDSFDDHEMALLNELAADLAFGVLALRTAAAHDRATAALRESEERFRTLVENSPDMIAQYDPSLRRVYVNPALCKATDIPKAELLSTSPGQRSPLPPAAVKALDKMLREVFDTGQMRDQDLVWERPPEPTVYIHLRAVPELDSSGKVLSVISIARDLSSLKHAEEELRASGEQLRALAARLQAVREEERTRVAREIHDEMGQLLTALKIDLRWIERDLEEHADPRLNPILDRAVAATDLTDTLAKAVQRVAAELRPSVLDRLGLVTALTNEAAQFQKRTGIRCCLTTPDPEPRLSPDVVTGLFRICQEALTNVAKHTRATEVSIAFQALPDALTLDIQDNGQGITSAQVLGSNSLGLLGMKERAGQLGGEVDIRPAPAGGTLVSVRIPQPQSKSEAQ